MVQYFDYIHYSDCAARNQTPQADENNDDVLPQNPFAFPKVFPSEDSLHNAGNDEAENGVEASADQVYDLL